MSVPNGNNAALEGEDDLDDEITEFEWLRMNDEWDMLLTLEEDDLDDEAANEREAETYGETYGEWYDDGGGPK